MNADASGDREAGSDTRPPTDEGQAPGTGDADSGTAEDRAGSDPETTYVHEPEGDRRAEVGETPTGPPEDREFGWRGWVLVGLTFVSFLVVPGLILWNPPALPYWVALLALPVLPGVLLGITAVWAAFR